MKKEILIIILLISSCYLFGQVSLLREGIIINNKETETWLGDKIPRSVPTTLIYRNNSITSLNSQGYMLQAGDETPTSTNNNLDGEVVTGNKFVWNGINSPSIITHGLFVGYNINSIVKYNYLDKVPYGIIYKSGTDSGVNMTFTAGGCAYNICKNGKFAVTMKGMNGVKVYNNTFYNEDSNGRYLVIITENSDRLLKSPSTGSKIFNNIFYATSNIPMISLESGCLTGFESDYNVYWCTVGEPTFNIDGITKTWAEWRELGYDAHSIIVDPNFIDFTDLVPTYRLNYGKDLGTEWQTGLSTTATWVAGTSPATQNQNGLWQVGARVYLDNNIPINDIKLIGENTITTDKGTLQLNASVLPANASNLTVNWSIADGTGQATISATGLVNAVNDGTVIASAAANDGSGVLGTMVVTISNQVILSDVTNKNNQKAENLRIIVSEVTFKVILNNDFLTFKVYLYNLQGVLIAEKIVDSDLIVFHTSKLPSGIYLVVLTNGIKQSVAKAIKP